MFKNVNAPFSEQQMASLQRFQACEMMHPYTCHHCSHKLVPIVDGLLCPEHGLVQTWVIGFTANGGWQDHELQMLEMVEELKRDDL
jgi:hypothetical protein